MICQRQFTVTVDPAVVCVELTTNTLSFKNDNPPGGSVAAYTTPGSPNNPNTASPTGSFQSGSYDNPSPTSWPFDFGWRATLTNYCAYTSATVSLDIITPGTVNCIVDITVNGVPTTIIFSAFVTGNQNFSVPVSWNPGDSVYFGIYLNNTGDIADWPATGTWTFDITF